MATDGTLNYAVTADTKGFSSGMQSAQAGIAKLSGGVGKLSGTLLKLGAAGAAAAGLAGGLAGIAKALGGAAQVESLGVALEVFTGSAEAGAAMLKDLKKLGAETAYDFPGLAEGAKTMMQFGIAADDVLPTLRHLGEIAGGDNEKIKALSLVWGQLGSTGRLTGGDLMQLINGGFNPLQEISAKTGESMEALKKRMEDGAISFAEVQQALVGATTEGGRFFGMMEKQSKTTTGLLSTLQDGVMEVFTTLGTPVNDALKPILENAIDIVGRIGQGLEAVVTLAQKAMAEGQLGSMFSDMLKIAAMEGVNYLVGALSWSAQLASRLFEGAFTNVVRLFAGEFDAVINALGEGLGQVLKGLSDIIRSQIGGPFAEIAARFRAGLQFAVEKMMEGLAKIPGMRKKMGLDEGFQGTPFSELLEEAMGADDPAALKAKGEAALRDGLGAMAAALKEGGGMLWDGFADALHDMEAFEPGKVFDSGEIKDRLKETAKALDPEAFQKLAAAVAGSGGEIAEATQHDALKISGAATATKEKEEKGKKAKDEEEKKKIRVHGLQESASRRLARMSQADRDKLASGRGSFANMDRGLLSNAWKASQGAGAGLTPPTRREQRAESKKSTETLLLEVLRQIATNTDPLKELGAA